MIARSWPPNSSSVTPSKASPERKSPEKTTPTDAAILTRSASGTRGSASTWRSLFWMSSCSASCCLVVQLLEGGLVPLVHEEDLALGQHLAGDLVDQLTPLLEGDRLVPHAQEGLLAELVDAHVQRQEDVVLGLEVVVQRGLGDAEAFGDLAQAGAVEALLGEEVERHIEDALAGVDVGGSVGGGGCGGGSWSARSAGLSSRLECGLVAGDGLGEALLVLF